MLPWLNVGVMLVANTALTLMTNVPSVLGCHSDIDKDTNGYQ